MKIRGEETNARILCKFREVKKLPTHILQGIFFLRGGGPLLRALMCCFHCLPRELGEAQNQGTGALVGGGFARATLFLVVKGAFGSSYHLVY